MTTPSNTNTITRKKLEPIGYEDTMAFVDYADRPGECKAIKMPIYDVSEHCQYLRSVRIEERFSLRAAATLLKLSPTELSGIEHGRLEATQQEINSWVAALRGCA